MTEQPGTEEDLRRALEEHRQSLEEQGHRSGTGRSWQGLNGAAFNAAVAELEESERARREHERAELGIERANAFTSLVQIQAKATRTMFSFVGIAIVLIAMTSYLLLRSDVPSNPEVTLLLMISFLTGVITLVYGNVRATNLSQVAEHPEVLRLLEFEFEDEDEDDDKPENPLARRLTEDLEKRSQTKLTTRIRPTGTHTRRYVTRRFNG